MKPAPVFINYTDPSEQTDKRNRRKVASYIGTHYRNRSKPSAKQESKPNSGNSSEQDQQIAKGKPGNVTRRPKQFTWRIGQHMASPMTVHDMHGFKSDPFESYPIPATEMLPKAIEYFFVVDGPTHLLRSSIKTAKSGQGLLQRYFRYIMQNAASFESLIALNLGKMQIHNWRDGYPDCHTSYHHSSATTRLRELLNTKDGYKEDAVIATVITLAATEYLIGNLDAIHAHIAGLRRIVELRGGINAIGWPEILKPMLTHHLASSRQDSIVTPEKLRIMAAKDNLGFKNSPTTTNPPAPTSIKSLQLPPGLQRLAQEDRLAEQIILLARVVFGDMDSVDLRHGSIAGKSATNIELTEYLFSLLREGKASLTEYVLLISINHHLHDLTATERLSSLYKEQIMKWTRECLYMIDWIDAQDEALVEMFVWLCMKLAGTLVASFLNMASQDTDDARFQLMMKVTKNFPQTRRWNDLRRVLMRFGWMPDCLHWWEVLSLRVSTEFNKT